MSLPHSNRTSIEKYLQARQRDENMRRLEEAAGPLVEAWGYDKYCEWCDTWISDIMTIDEIVETMHRFYPEETNPLGLQGAM